MILCSGPLVIPDATRGRLLESLDSWTFEPNKLPEEEVLACTYILFESLMCREGVQADTHMSLSEFSPTLPGRVNAYTSRSNRVLPVTSTRNVSRRKLIPQLPACAGRPTSNPCLLVFRWGCPSCIDINVLCRRTHMETRQINSIEPLHFLSRQRGPVCALYCRHRP